MELRYWLVPGNVKNNRVNQLSNASAVNSLDVWTVWSPGFKVPSKWYHWYYCNAISDKGVKAPVLVFHVAQYGHAVGPKYRRVAEWHFNLSLEHPVLTDRKGCSG